jgi:hypothetical protein
MRPRRIKKHIMAGSAQVTSVEAIAAFRSNLIIYLAKARGAIDEISNEVTRARRWLESDCYRHWEQERRIRGRKLEEARNELSTAQLSNLKTSSSVQLAIVQRAERAVREAEAKLMVIKKWDRELENKSEPLIKQTNQLHNFLTAEMPGAVAQLTQIVTLLEAYADVNPAPGGQRSGGESA